MRGTLLRRARTIPLTFVLCAVSWAVLPALLPLTLLFDLVRGSRGGRSFAVTRLFVFAPVYFASEVIGLSVLAASWLRHLGDKRALVEPTYAIQGAWTAFLLGAIARIYGVSFEVKGLDALARGDVIVLVRHASIVDTLLPTVLLARPTGLHLRFVLKRELLALPCLDVAGNRIPNCFVARDGASSEAEIARVAALADDLGERDGVLIYPEGTRFTEEKLRRALEKLATSAPERAARLRALRRLLPIRPGGVLALCARAPEADVVLVSHTGLEGLAEIGDILRGGLVGRRVTLSAERHVRAALPHDPEALLAWLDARWLELDAALAEAKRP